MKISTELRHIVNSRFSTFAGKRVQDDKIKHYLAVAARKQPEIGKAITAFNKAVEQVKAVQKYMKGLGIHLYADGDMSISDDTKFAKLVNLPPRPPTRNEVLHKLSSLTPAEGVAYLKTLGIDWS